MLVRHKDLIFDPEDVKSVEINTQNAIIVRFKRSQYVSMLRNASGADLDAIWELVSSRRGHSSSDPDTKRTVLP